MTVIAFILFGGIYAWLDGPRRFLEGRLADTLDMDVSLRSWSAEGAGLYRLSGLILRTRDNAPGPMLEFRADEVEVAATLDELLQRRLRQLKVRGAELTIVRSTSALESRTSPMTGPPPRLDRLEIQPLAINVCTVDTLKRSSLRTCRRSPELSLNGNLDGGGIGGSAPELEIRLSATELDTEALPGLLDAAPPTHFADVRIEGSLRRAVEGCPAFLETDLSLAAGTSLSHAGALSLAAEAFQLDAVLGLPTSIAGRVANVSVVSSEPESLGDEADDPVLCSLDLQAGSWRAESPDWSAPLSVEGLTLRSDGRLKSPLWQTGRLAFIGSDATLELPLNLSQVQGAVLKLEAAALAPLLDAVRPSPLTGHLNLRLSAPLDAPWTGHLELEGRSPSTAPPLPSRDPSIKDLRWEAPFTLDDGRFSSIDGHLTSIVSVPSLNSVHLKGRTRIELPPSSSDVGPSAQILVERLWSPIDDPSDPIELGTLELSVPGGASEERDPYAELRLQWDSSAAEVLRWASPHLPPVLADWTVSGRSQIEGAIFPAKLQSPDPGTLASVVWRMEETGFSHQDGDRAVDGLNIETELTWARHPEHLELLATGRSGGFLMLWRTLFADLSWLEVPFEMQLRQKIGLPGTAPSPPNGVPGTSTNGVPGTASSISRWTWSSTWRPTSAPELQLDGTLNQDGSGQARIDLNSDDLSPFFDRVVGPTLGWVDPESQEPTSASLEGKAHIELVGTWPASGATGPFGLAGHSELVDLDLRLPEAHIDKLNLSWPIHLKLTTLDDPGRPSLPWPKSDLAESPWSGPQTGGRVSWQGAEVYGIPISAVESSLTMEGDNLRLDRGLELRLLDGTVHADEVSVSDWLSDDPSARMNLRFDNLSLAALTRSRGLPVIEGRLAGELQDVGVTARRLETTGGGHLSLLGGQVRIRDISGSEIFTDFPKLRFSADLEGIDLARLTDRFDVGQVTGLLDGQVESCELFRGTPTTFEAVLRTRKAKGVPQTVDVKAVKNLTILGTGQGTHIFDQGVQRFLSHYKYSAFGAEIQLRDDVLFLRGLEKRGDKELFLKGGFPFGIDIVNARPGQTVSFQTMVGRLQSLDISAADVKR